MKESNDEIKDNSQIKTEEESISTSKNILVNENINESSEITNIKPKKNKSEFEYHIIESYKIITGFYQSNQNVNYGFINIQLCEKEMRIALDICKKSSNIKLNKNILDKISRIMMHNQINILLIIGKIFIDLMNKENLFVPSDKKTDLNIIISFINEICNLNSLLKETYLANKLNKISNKFIEKIISDFHFEQEQII